MTGEQSLATAQRNGVNGVYTLGNTIGTGHYAVVKLARHIFSERNVAVKVIDKLKLDEISKAHLFQEVMCMKLVQHPHVVRLYEVIDTPNKLYLILEFADGGDMYDYITKHANGLSESVARKYFRQICQGLKYCHQMRVCHRDLKPENLVFFERQGVVKLTDFGFSNQFTPGNKLLTSCGSLAYSAPEILLGDPYDAAAVDIWSLGVILFMLVTGRAPFQEANDPETVMMILDCVYKLPSHLSVECQNLIRRMIVRDPERRASLDEVMSDVWYLQDIDENNPTTILSHRTMSGEDHQRILRQMVEGNIAEQDVIIKALEDNQYNHITATYYLLAEKIFYEKFEQEERTSKRTKRLLQQSSVNEPPPEQIGVFLSPSAFNFDEVSLPLTRQNSVGDEEDEIEEYADSLLKDNQSTSSKYLTDSSNDQVLSPLVEDDEEQHVVSQQQQVPRTPSGTSQPTPAQAMKIIPEEDEYPESPSTEKTTNPLQSITNHPKLNKIVETEEPDRSPSACPKTPSNVLRSKDLRSVIENKRRNFVRSGSSSDSEDATSNYEVYRPSNRKNAPSPTFHESELNIYSTNHRGRSFSNVDHVSGDAFASSQASTLVNTTADFKRRSFSRTSSIISNNRFAFVGTNDDSNGDVSIPNSFTYLPERTQSLSVDHRLTNPSQMSISSRISIRYSTPRESTVFTKSEAPAVVRLIQQTPHQDPSEAIRTIIEHQRSQQELSQTPIIVEEDLATPLISQYKTSPTTNRKPSIHRKVSEEDRTSNDQSHRTTKDNQHRHSIIGQITPMSSTSSSRSMLSTLKYSLIKHQQRKSARDELSCADEKQKQSVQKHRLCCILS